MIFDGLYPSPPELIERMIAPYTESTRWYKHLPFASMLEPSAGKAARQG